MIMIKEKWQQPCKFLGNFILVEKQNSFPERLVIQLNSAVQKIESKYSYQFLDLFADLGGYLGIFLGYSLFQLKDAIAYLMRKI